jgi:drug/metabolite transporter (DMT)-like permease
MVCAIPLLALVVTRFSSKREAIGRRRALGVALGAIGVVLLVGLDLHGGSLKWIALMLGVCVGYTIGPMILARPLAHVPGPVVVCGATGVVALGWLPYSLAHWPHHVDWRTGASLATLSVVCTATAFLVFFELIKESGPSKSLVVVYVNTALAVVLGIALLHEPLTKGIVLGFPLIVVGSYFATSSATIADVAAEAGAHPDIVTDH